MTRKIHQRPTRNELIARLPRAFRPKLRPDQTRELSLCHLENLSAIADGAATAENLRQWVGGVLTWYRAAQLLGLGEPEMRQQLTLATSVLERFARLGRVGFSGPEYQLAKDGVDVMDQLAAAVDAPTARTAAEWSEARIQQFPAEATLADI